MTKQAVHKRFAGPLAERLTSMTGAPTFERFTQRARNVLVTANAAAQASGHLEVGTGHLLLALFADPDGIAAKVLAGLQAGQPQVEAALHDAWAQPTGPRDEPAGPAGADDVLATAGDPGLTAAGEAAGRLPMSPAARAALVNAVAVALEFGHNYIGTEHILLALYRDPDSLAARVLAGAGAGGRQAEALVRKLLHGYTAP
ncbi:MAG TPA: Clp protease N-terminal domain-containing protein [Streptosporangiaceae bacterium]